MLSHENISQFEYKMDFLYSNSNFYHRLSPLEKASLKKLQ